MTPSLCIAFHLSSPITMFPNARRRKDDELVFVPPRFDVYRPVSAQIHAIFAEYTDLIEPLALDEAYLDVTANRRGLETAWLTAKAIRARILEETGLTASAGISYNKFLAKLASSQRKSLGSETTFEQDLTDPARIEAGVFAMADDVWAWCEKTGGRGRTVMVKINGRTSSNRPAVNRRRRRSIAGRAFMS